MSERESTLKVSQIIEIIDRRRWFSIVPFCIAMIIGIILVFILPKVYEASTLILVEAQRVPEDYVQSIVSSDLDSRIDTISQQILSRSNLEKVVKQLNLFSGPQYQGMLMIDKIANLRKSINIQVTRGGRSRTPDSFSITCRGRSPEDIKNIVNTIASGFIYENLKVREEQASGTSDFLEGELTNMRKKLEAREEAMKNFRKKYMGELPEQLESNLRMLDRLQDQLIDRQSRLSDAKNRLALLLDSISSNRHSSRLSTVPEGISELERLQGELKELQAKYTDRHPDIIRLKKRIAILQAREQEQKSEAQPDKVETHPMSRGDHQALLEVRQEIYNITNEVVDLQEQIKRYKRRVENTPKREQELMSLQRDYQNIQQSYSSLQSRKLEADIAVNMEKKQKGERFRVIDYARVPQRPTSPDMKKLLLMVIAVGFGAGAGIIFLLEYSDSSFRNSDDIEAFIGLPVLAEIPQLVNPKDILKKRLHQIVTAISLVISLVLFLGFSAVALIGVEKVKALVRL